MFMFYQVFHLWVFLILDLTSKHVANSDVWLQKWLVDRIHATHLNVCLHLRI